MAEFLWMDPGVVCSGTRTFVWEHLCEGEVVRWSLQPVLEHGAADHLPRVLPVAQHDALVHDHTWTQGGVCDYKQLRSRCRSNVKNCVERTVSGGQTGQDSQGRTVSRGQSGEDSQGRTVRGGQSGEDSQGRTVRGGQSEVDSQQRTVRGGQSEDSQRRTV